MKPGMTYSNPIKDILSLKLAALQYLEYLDYNFRPALEYSVDDYEIITGLKYSELFSSDILTTGEYRRESLVLYTRVIEDLKAQLESEDFIVDVLHNSWVNSLVGPEEQIEMADFENDKWVGYLDLRIRLINTLTSFYFLKIESLVTELVATNPQEYWWVSFYVTGSQGLTQLIETIDSDTEGRATMNFYLQCLIDFNDRFAQLKGTQFRLDLFVSNNWSQSPRAEMEVIDLEHIHKNLVQKLQQFYQKLTVVIPAALLRDMFVKLSSGKPSTLLVCHLSDFLKNEFHCIDSIYDRKSYEYSILEAVGSELFSFFRLLIDREIIVGVTKPEIGLLLRYKFVGFTGFSQHNAKTYLERKFFEKKSNDSRLKKKVPVTAKFEAKYPGLLNGCPFYTSEVFKSRKKCTSSLRKGFEKFTLHLN